MSQLTRNERRALLEMQDQQGVEAVAPEATNRQMRRRLEKAQKNARRGR
jgi:ribosome maturation protein Sdo1